MRPILDYQLSWIDEEENVRFDSDTIASPEYGVTTLRATYYRTGGFVL